MADSIGKSTKDMAGSFGVNEETIRRYKRDKQYKSFAHDMLEAKKQDINQTWDALQKAVMTLILEGDPATIRLIYNTMAGKLLSTKGNESTTTEDRSLEDKQALLKEILRLNNTSTG